MPICQNTNIPKGKNHWGWKGGINDDYYRRLSRDYLEKICKICGNTKNLLIHHKNRKHKDNRLENLEIVCRSCHEKIHNKARNFYFNNFWKDSEIDFLCINYKKMRDKEIAKLLNRTSNSITMKRAKLGFLKYKLKE